MPSHYEQACETLTPQQVAEKGRVRADPDEHRQAIAEFEDAGFSRVYLHQVGRNQEPFFAFYEREFCRRCSPLRERREPARPGKLEASLYVEPCVAVSSSATPG